MLKSAILAVSLAGLLFLAACAKTHEPEVTYFIVRVDSIAVPDSIPQADTLRMTLYGTIGNNGDYAFDRFESTLSPHDLALTVWGKYTYNDYATQVIVGLNREFPVFPLYRGMFRICVIQPDSSNLLDSVLVY